MISIANLSVDELARHAVRMREGDDPEGATKVLREALKRHPREAILWQSLGLAHRAMLETTEALDALGQAARLAPHDGKIAHALAHVTMEGGLPAVDLFDRAVRLRPDDGSVIIGRTAALFAAGDHAAAINDLEQTCRSSPLWLEGHAALASLKWQLGQSHEFVSSYREALTRDPHSAPLWLGLVEACLRVERYEWAQTANEAASEALGDSPQLMPVRAICASELGDHNTADTLFAKLLSQQTYLRDTDLLTRGVRHLLRTNRTAAAVALAQNGLNRPDANKLWPYVATAWRMLDDPQWQWLEGDPRLVKRVKLYEPEELAALVPVLRSLHQLSHEPAGQSVRSGSQTDGPLFARIEPEIRDLRQRIEKALRTHVADLGEPDPRHPVLQHRPKNIRFAGSWSVRLQGAGHHSNHVHPQGWLSSALYLAVPAAEESGPPPAGHLQLGVPPAELGIALEPIAAITPEPGWLTLFPSTMWHGTVPILGGERMTVAFDVKP
ncbi:MAG: 2OG-Fe(II) oxygenase family protein [Erythrobacter sp.]